MLAFRNLMASAVSVSEGACGHAGEATGPQSNECLKPDAKPSLFMRQVSPALSSASTSLPSPPFGALDSHSPCSVPASPTHRHIPHFDLDFIAGDVGNERCEFEVQKEGVLWTVTCGVPPSISQLEDHLAHVKALYTEKFGEDIDEEEADDDASNEDGVMWTVTRGTPPSMPQLEDRLSDIKALYKTKFGEDLDSEEREDDEVDVEKDGVVWTVTRGAPPSMSQLEDRLSDVRALYKAKFGEDLDSEERAGDAVERDGIMWTVTRSVPPSMSQLEDRLSDVKALYKAKFGEDLDSEERADDDVMWTVMRGAPPSMSQLEDRLSDVMALFKAKFGEDIDSEEREDYTSNVEKDGVVWNVTRAAPPSMSQLEDRLSDVKALYKAKFGEDLDSEERADDEVDVEKDGVVWTVTRGAPPSMPQLEDRLSDVMALYKAKFGEDLDSEERADDEADVEKDGVVWTVTRGAPPSMSQLEDRLSDVMALYKAKFGEDIDSEEREDYTSNVEKDGVVWTVTRAAPPSMPQLEDRLSDVKALYKAKFGEDIDSEDREDDEGVTWTITRGTPPSMSQLEDRLFDVKALYEAKYGEKVDAGEEEDDDVKGRTA